MSFEIKKSKSAPGPRVSWPWKNMCVGDEVTITDPLMVAKAQINAHTYGRQAGMKFTTRTVDGALKVWRVE